MISLAIYIIARCALTKKSHVVTLPLSAEGMFVLDGSSWSPSWHCSQQTSTTFPFCSLNDEHSLRWNLVTVAACVVLTLTFFSAVFCVVSQFAAVVTASGVRLLEELHLHH